MSEPSKPLGVIDLARVKPPEPGLHIVATPIGNLADISLRALATLARADAVYCEDTRITRRLAGRYALDLKLRAYHDHNAAKTRPEILGRLAAGETVALVSDAGTPLVSDPGYKLVVAALDAGHKVTCEPGASSVMAALVLAGMPTDRFLFIGFLPPKSAARRAEIVAVKTIRASLVLFEAPSRLAATLADLASCLGGRPAAVLREMTKLHEEVKRGSLNELAAEMAQGGTPKGELVIVVAPPGEAVEVDAIDVDSLLRQALAHASLKAAVAEVSAKTGHARREIYARALRLAKSDD